MSTAKILSRVELFRDSGEIAAGLRSYRGEYWPNEAAVHIEGLWQLVQAMAERLSPTTTEAR